jgi:hypothetical protein
MAILSPFLSPSLATFHPSPLFYVQQIALASATTALPWLEHEKFIPFELFLFYYPFLRSALLLALLSASASESMTMCDPGSLIFPAHT